MSKLSSRELARLLTSRRTFEPPTDLADRIKAEMPEFAAVGVAGLEHKGVAGMRPRESGYRPFLLLAATLLVVIGVGFIAAHLLEPPADLARDVALGGVTAIDDIVITVPPRTAIEPRPLPGSPASSAIAHAAPMASEGPAPASLGEGVTVVVRRVDGAPCAGVTVKLQRTDVTPPWRSDTATDATGVASFSGVPVGTYTLSAGVADGRPATLELLHVAPKTVTRIDLRIAPRRAHTALPF